LLSKGWRKCLRTSEALRVGDPRAERMRIFEQFHQIDNSNTKTKGGTGLGLAIAKEIVEMHGGRNLGWLNLG